MKRRPANVVLIALLLVASGATVSAIWRFGGPDIFARRPEPVPPAIEATAADPGDPPNTFGGSQPIVSPKPGDPPGYTRVPAPKVEGGARRIGIQVGHWQTDNVPPELRRLEVQTGTSWNGITETEVSLDIATRLAALLRGHGYIVDIIPTTVPVGYLADVFLALHADGDGTGENSGFKIAHGSRRGPYEDKLVAGLTDEYAKLTGLENDVEHVSRAMSAYYAFNWGRYQHAAAAHTPAAILEMGYLSNDHDRDLLVNRADGVATAIVNGLQRFLDEVPRSKIFGEDLIVPPQRSFPSPSPRT